MQIYNDVSIDLIRKSVGNGHKLNPAEFLEAFLDQLAAQLGAPKLCYWVGDAGKGPHVAIAHGFDDDFDHFALNNWHMSGLPGVITRYRKQPLLFDEIASQEFVAHDPALATLREVYQSKPVAFVADANWFDGKVDGLLVFDGVDAQPTSWNLEALREAFVAIRLGLVTSIERYVRDFAANPHVKQCWVIDQYGDVYGSSCSLSEVGGVLGKDGIEVTDFSTDKVISSRATGAARSSAGAATLFLAYLPAGSAFEAKLSRREQQIATRIAAGLSYKSIASELGIALSTVSNQASRIRTKLDLRNREEIAAYFNGSTMASVEKQ